MTFRGVRLAHLADPHLGVRQYHRQTPAGINQREADVAHAFRAGDGRGHRGAPRRRRRRRRPLPLRPSHQRGDRLRLSSNSSGCARRCPTRRSFSSPATTTRRARSETGSILRLFEELGVDVAADEARRLEYPELDLSVLAVPHQALVGGERPVAPAGRRGARHRVLVLHGEIEGVLPTERSQRRRSTAARWSTSRSSAPRSGATSRWATTTCSTRWRRTPGMPARSSTSARTSGASCADEAEQGSAGQGLAAGRSRRRQRRRASRCRQRAPILDLEPIRGRRARRGRR